MGGREGGREGGKEKSFAVVSFPEAIFFLINIPPSFLPSLPPSLFPSLQVAIQEHLAGCMHHPFPFAFHSPSLPPSSCPSSRAEKECETQEEATSSSFPPSSSPLLSLLCTASDLQSVTSLHSSFLSSLAKRAFLSDGNCEGGGGSEGRKEGGQGGTSLVRNQMRHLVRLALRCVVEEEKEGGIDGEEAYAQTCAGKAVIGGREGGKKEGLLVYREFEEKVVELMGLLTRLVGNHEDAPWVEALRVRLDYNGFFSASASR